MSKFSWGPDEKLVRADAPRTDPLSQAIVRRFFHRRHEPTVRTMLRECITNLRAVQNQDTRDE